MTTPNSISGNVFLDSAGQGIYNSLFGGMPGWHIALYAKGSPSKLVATKETDASGSYEFDDLAPGVYYVYVTNQPAEYRPTGKSATYFAITLAAGASSTANNFGQQPLAAVTPPAPAPATPTNVPLGTDLVSLLNAAPANASYVLATGTYELQGTPTIKSAGVKLNLNGSRLDFFPAPGATSDIVIRAVNFEMFGGVIGRGVVTARTYGAGTFLHDLNILGIDAKAGTGINTLLLCDIGGSGAKVQKCSQGGPCNSVLIYSMADNLTVGHATDPTQGNHFAFGSLGEDVIRFDCDQNGRSPSGGVVANNPVLSNVSNVYHKEVVAIRKGKAVVENNGSITPAATGGDCVRAGEKSGTAPGSNATVTIIGNVFPSVCPGYPQISIVQGVAATIAGNTLEADSSQMGITVDGHSTAAITATIRRRTVKSEVVKTALWAAAPGQTPVVTESGTTVVDP